MQQAVSSQVSQCCCRQSCKTCKACHL